MGYNGIEGVNTHMTVKELRTAAKMSQREFSEYLGVPVRTLQKWETGERTPPDYVVSMIERRLYMENSINVRRMPTIEELTDIYRQSGYEVKTMNLREAVDRSCSFNPFLAATEHAVTIEEKSIKLRELLDIPEYGPEYATQRLMDMSFLDNEPEWQEIAVEILKEYVKKR